ncbi:MAG: adenylosuccinate lyase [Pseudomonadota bacterium]
MIDRYSRKQMSDIWTEENKYRHWLKVEILVCEALAKLGEIPGEAIENICKKADFSVDRVHEIEAITRHDVIAFLTNVSECVGPDARYLHLGMTSSDVLDTAVAVLLREAADILLSGIDSLLNALKERAFEHKHTVMIGRSHGIHAEPITFGLKLAVWYDEMQRNRRRMEQAKEIISVGMISGAVGTFANISPEVEEYVCERLGLRPEPASTQVIQRDRHAEYLNVLAITASSIEKMAVEIRHLQRTEVLEAEEYFAKGQKGSSAMPHKRNPIASENLSGLARVIRANAQAAMGNIALWHERDISHSSVERIILPDSTILLDYMLHRFTGVIKNLIVYPERMRRNLGLTNGLIFSQQILLALAIAGISRESAYALVQKEAMKVWEEGADFKTLLMNNDEIQNLLGREKIEQTFDVEYHLRYIDTIFKRVFGE